jgi:cytochrome c5
MSDAHNEHQSIIRTPKQLIAAVAGFFLVIVIGIILLVTYATSGKTETGTGTNSQSAEAVEQRLQPVAEQGYALKDVNAPKTLQSGEAIYTSTCAACHGTGAAGAPKFGDSAAWGPRLAQGEDTLIQHAVQGIRAMPAKGGNVDLDNVEVARAVVYMANKAGASFKEPAAPAAGAAAPAAASEANAAAAQAPAASAPGIAATPAKNVATAESAAPAAPAAQSKPAAADAGKALYTSTCQACHGAGIAGAPKFGDKAAWAPRVKQGNAVLYDHAIKGFQGKAGMMPAKGGSTASDDDVKAAVDYMAAAAK